MTETGEYILIKALNDLVTADDYYKVKTILEKMREYFDEEQRWLNTQWIGRALKRLGFTDKRRVGRGVEYLIRRKQVEDLVKRLGIEEERNENNEQLELASQKRMIFNYVERNIPTQKQLMEFIKANNIPKEALAELIREDKVIETKTSDGELRFIPNLYALNSPLL